MFFFPFFVVSRTRKSPFSERRRTTCGKGEKGVGGGGKREGLRKGWWEGWERGVRVGERGKEGKRE